MARGKSKSKSKYNLDELLERLEEASPGMTDRIPEPSAFHFFTDNTKEQNRYVKIGHYKPDAAVPILKRKSKLKTKDKTNPKDNPKTNLEDNPKTNPKNNLKTKKARRPVWIRLKDTNTMFHWVDIQYALKIMPRNKDFAESKVKCCAPFNLLPPIRSRPPASSEVETMKWFTELRALTMFAFVWCGESKEFVDFKRGEGFTALLEVLERLPEEGGIKEQEESSEEESDEDEDEEEETGEKADQDVCGSGEREGEVDAGTIVQSVPDAFTDAGIGASQNVEHSDNQAGSEAKASARVWLKRTHDDYTEDQKD
ncbi:hypothetical protein BU23DRAFT_555369 [Bimuria novae-zelandiae CBS 107.79]|uniref:Uncharacterized protein n=1 Tax=Bimuria novae-zelandiae CBS 107.79 TaxID=1447943 RepID=A0A6A5V4F2_9PLEO|nr:hypothetical protein BU23DRAFT_555369 [Bimuria novae-zelandiae CBS 107.79]